MAKKISSTRKRGTAAKCEKPAKSGLGPHKIIKGAPVPMRLPIPGRAVNEAELLAGIRRVSDEGERLAERDMPPPDSTTAPPRGAKRPPRRVAPKSATAARTGRRARDDARPVAKGRVVTDPLDPRPWVGKRLPHQPDRLGAATIFLRESFVHGCSNMPGCFWHWDEDPRLIAGLLLHNVVPRAVVYRFELGLPERLPPNKSVLDAFLELGTAGGSRAARAVATQFREVAKSLAAVSADATAALPALTQATGALTRILASEDRLPVSYAVYRGVVAAGKAFLEDPASAWKFEGGGPPPGVEAHDFAGFSMGPGCGPSDTGGITVEPWGVALSPRRWRELCRKAVRDPEAAAQVREVWQSDGY